MENKNRELKFRVWNGTKMEYDITVGRFGAFYVNPEKGDGLNPNDAASLSVNTTKYFDAPIMQYTGLKDKSGIPIYESDIIEYEVGINPRSTKIKKVITHYVDGFRGCVVGNKIRKNYLNQEIMSTPKQISMKYWEACKVIGNIYENPELLNA